MSIAEITEAIKGLRAPIEDDTRRLAGLNPDGPLYRKILERRTANELRRIELEEALEASRSLMYRSHPRQETP